MASFTSEALTGSCTHSNDSPECKCLLKTLSVVDCADERIWNVLIAVRRGDQKPKADSNVLY
jgi:hypothetical protein